MRDLIAKVVQAAVLKNMPWLHLTNSPSAQPEKVIPKPVTPVKTKLGKEVENGVVW